MVEIQIINKILGDRSIDILTRNGITADQFLVERDKLDFILNHRRQYGQVPDVVTFLSNFEDFELFDVDESAEYLVAKLREAQAFAKVVPILKEASDKVREDALDGIVFIKNEIDNLIRSITGERGQGYDIIANANDRLEEYRRRAEMRGLLGIPTGISKLDEILHGWLNEDMVLMYARTNEGKSWLLLYFLVAAWLAGKRVGMYSGEMGNFLVGFRFDTIHKNFNNMGLMSGSAQLGDTTNDEVGSRSAQDYERYINALRGQGAFVLCTQKDFGGKKPTVDELEQFWLENNLDLLGVDQISLMNDQRKGRDKRERFTNIAEDLFLLSEKLQKPILAVGQANREAAKGKKKEEETPDLHEIAESDGLPQNATRCIAMKVVNKVLRISIKKNRYGRNNVDVLMLWETNLGIFKPMLADQTAEQATSDYGF